MESKPRANLCNYFVHFFCLAVWRFSGLPITIRKGVRPLFRPLAALMFPCTTPLRNCGEWSTHLSYSFAPITLLTAPTFSRIPLKTVLAKKTAEAALFKLNSIGKYTWILVWHICKTWQKMHYFPSTLWNTLSNSFLCTHLMEKKAFFSPSLLPYAVVMMMVAGQMIAPPTPTNLNQVIEVREVKGLPHQ